MIHIYVSIKFNPVCFLNLWSQFRRVSAPSHAIYFVIKLSASLTVICIKKSNRLANKNCSKSIIKLSRHVLLCWFCDANFQATVKQSTSSADKTAAMQVGRNVNQSRFQQMIRLSVTRSAWNLSAHRQFLISDAQWVISHTYCVFTDRLLFENWLIVGGILLSCIDWVRLVNNWNVLCRFRFFAAVLKLQWNCLDDQ